MGEGTLHCRLNATVPVLHFPARCARQLPSLPVQRWPTGTAPDGYHCSAHARDCLRASCLHLTYLAVGRYGVGRCSVHTPAAPGCLRFRLARFPAPCRAIGTPFRLFRGGACSAATSPSRRRQRCPRPKTTPVPRPPACRVRSASRRCEGSNRPWCVGAAPRAVPSIFIARPATCRAQTQSKRAGSIDAGAG